MMKYLLLFSRQGKLRLAKWFTTIGQKAKARIIQDLTTQVLARRARMCNVLESVIVHITRAGL
jgi:AP-1 complex subunit sigma 1/2